MSITYKGTTEPLHDVRECVSNDPSCSNHPMRLAEGFIPNEQCDPCWAEFQKGQEESDDDGD